jgi:glutamate 5-kinase
MTREAVAAAPRLVVKVGSSSLTTAAGGLDPDRLDALVDALAERPGQLVLVSSGAIAAGLAPLGLPKRPRDLATQQAAASVGQMLLVQRYAEAFARSGRTVGQVLLTADDVVRRAHYRNARTTFDRLLALGVVPVVNENDAVATEEIRFGDNDRLAALVAHLVRADALLLLSDVDGLHDGDPRTPGTRLVETVAGPDDLAGLHVGSTGTSGLGRGGMASKVEAASLATRAGIPVLLAATSQVRAALRGEGGTSFEPTGTRAPPGCSGWRTPPPRGAGCCWTPAPSRRWSAGACRCCPPASPRWRGPSTPATRSSWPARTARPWLVAWSATTPPSCPRCSAGPLASWGCARWSTETTSWCCRAVVVVVAAGARGGTRAPCARPATQ